MSQVMTDRQIAEAKRNKLLDSVNVWAGFYRANPHRFVIEVLLIKLKMFQQVLLYMMFKSDNFLFIAARSLGKTFLVAVFSVTYAILYPNAKIVVCSATFKQGRELINKVKNELMPRSTILCDEIKRIIDGQNQSEIIFWNGSTIRVVVANESARGGRSHILIIDESRLVLSDIVDRILRPMNGTPRHQPYMDKPEYAHLQEPNKEIHMTSAFYASSETYDKCKAYTANMLDDKRKYFVCDLPYQLSIKNGLLMRSQIENEMSEATFSDITFMMEREGLFYGSSEDALFEYKTLSGQRVLKDGLKPLEYYVSTNTHIPDKLNGERRILSIDVALMASRKHRNDASCIIIHSAVPNGSGNYTDNIAYIETIEGAVTDDLGLTIMRYYNQYKCDYMVVDAQGVGMGVLDYCMQDRYDPMYNQTYSALNVVNGSAYDGRCKVSNAPKVIYAIKASAKLNNEITLAVRSAFQNGNINLLLPENEADFYLPKVRGYKSLSSRTQELLTMPYVQTSQLINELVNLEYDVVNGFIKVKEKSGMRKDRYSSLGYGYYVVRQLGITQKKQIADKNALSRMLGQHMKSSSLCS